MYSANRSEGTSEAIEGQKDIAGPNIGRSYLTEDDFLTMGGRWDRSNLDMRKITVLRKSTDGAGETEIVNPEGFSLRVLLDMQQKLRVLDRIIQKTCGLDEYKQMKNELDTVNKKLLDLTLDNRLTSGSMNPQFLMWDEVDQQAIDIPLWNPERNWHWIEEGVEWTENDNECTIEIF